MHFFTAEELLGVFVQLDNYTLLQVCTDLRKATNSNHFVADVYCVVYC